MKRLTLMLCVAACGLLAVSAREFHAAFDGYLKGFEGQTVTVQARTYDRGLDPYDSNVATAVVGTNGYLNAVVTFSNEIFNAIEFAQLDGKLPDPLPIRWIVNGPTLSREMTEYRQIHAVPYAVAAAKAEDVVITGSAEVTGDLTVTGQTTVTNLTAQTLALAKTDSTKGSVTLAPQNSEFQLTGVTAELVAPPKTPFNYVGYYQEIGTYSIGAASTSDLAATQVVYTAQCNCLLIIDLWGKLSKKTAPLALTNVDEPVSFFGLQGSTGQAAKFFSESFSDLSRLDGFGQMRPWLTINTPNAKTSAGVKSRLMIPMSKGETITASIMLGSLTASSFLSWNHSLRGFSYSRISESQTTMTLGIHPITTLEVVK